MEFLPILKLRLLNGWVYLAVFYGCFGLYLLSCSKAIVKKLYSVADWEKQYYKLSAIGKPFSVASLLLIVFSSIKFNTVLFWLGTFIYLAGFTIMFIALFTYRKTPADQAVRDGIYQYSRNPQWVGLVFIFIGTAMSCGNGLALLLSSIGIVLYHFRIQGEESACLISYGQSFQDYMDSVPRYFSLKRKKER
ncbi:MAG TPA: hypothetical protein G4N92_03895 [Anaerolineae bacterium]|nr:hypothetical protein [Anaerolineae bacterium]